MEFHIAIMNILKYKGQEFLLDPKMVNALVDFQAYEFHPAMKNIFRTLYNDNYITKIAQQSVWDDSCDQLVYEVERDYAFPKDLVEYILKSVAYGIGVYSEVIVPPSNTQSKKLRCRALQNNTSSKPWKSLSVEAKESVIKRLIEIDSSFSSIGLHLEDMTIVINEYAEDFFTLNYEVVGIIANTADETETFTIRVKIKNKKGGIRLLQDIQNLQAYYNGTDVRYECSNSIIANCKLSDIDSINISIREV